MSTDPTSASLVYTVAGTADVTIERDHQYTTPPTTLGFDLYRPPGTSTSCPAVILVNGLPDPGVVAMLKKPLKDWSSYIGWGRMLAASGIIAIAYTNRVAGDVDALVHHVRANAAALGIDAERIGVWACSGHGPAALALVARERFASAALLYPYLLDLDGATDVATAAAQFHFAAPPVTLDQLPRDMPMLVVRAGRDTMPGLEPALQRFIAAARARELPVTLIDHPEGPHAFDVSDDSPATRSAIDGTLAFLRRTLQAG
jgi:dienelactone hydrolase